MPVAKQPGNPEQRLLHLLGATSFEELESDAEARALRGIAPGRMYEHRDAKGALVALRPKQYSSCIEAGVDAAFARLEDRCVSCERALEQQHANPPLGEPASERTQADLDLARAILREAQRLRPITRRWTLQRDLCCLVGVTPPETAPQAAERPKGETVLPEATEGPICAPIKPTCGYDDNLRVLRRARMDAEATRIAAELMRFEMRQSERIRALRIPDTNEAFGERVRLTPALACWDDENPALDREIFNARAREVSHNGGT